MLVDKYLGFCAHAGQIWIEDPLPDLPLRQIKNENLTEIFIRVGSTGKLLRRLNQCRIYLLATTIADITTGDGLQIMEKAWKGELSWSRPTCYTWPRQGRPGEQAWGNEKKLKTALRCNHQ